jgi:hypothetical protein
MGSLVLLPGEREVLCRRPSPAGWIPRYALALLPALWAAALWTLFHTPDWENHRAGDALHFWTYLYGTPLAAHLYAAAGLAAGGYVLSLARRSWHPLAVALLIAACAGAMTLTLGAPATVALPSFIALSSIPCLAWAELCRLGTHHHYTNLRTVLRATFPRRMESSARHADLADLDVRQGPLARLLDAGTLLPVTAEHGPRKVRKNLLDPPHPAPDAPMPLHLVGVRPLGRIRHLVEVLVRMATASDYLRSEQKLDQRVADALAALQRR